MDYSKLDREPITRYIDKEKILSYVSEEEIFELVFGFKPEEYQYTCSPFRNDNNPGCWFERGFKNGKLLFIDFGDPYHHVEDCFGCVKRFFNLPNFYQSLLFIKEHLIDGVQKVERVAKIEKPLFLPQDRKRVEIYITPRNFIQSDRIFWSKYGITRLQLTSDKVIPVRKFALIGSKKGDIVSTVYTNCYAYTNFPENRKKLYFPYKKDKGRFITNCTQNDIGGLASLSESEQIVITKSYKDYRVLRNQGVNVIWFQNEGMIPDDNILIPLLQRFKDIVVFFDNDSTGITASNKLVEIIKNFGMKARSIMLPIELLEEHVKDASDTYYLKGEDYLKNFLKDNQIESCLETKWIQVGIPY